MTHSKIDGHHHSPGRTPERRVSERIHPVIYKTALGLTLWFVLVVWFLFGRGSGYQEFDLVMVSFVMIAAFAIPVALYTISGNFARTHMHRESPPAGSFRAWLGGDFRSWSAQTSASAAAVQILLPIAAAALGATLLGIALHLAV